jgi:hypothetical protein
MAAVHRDEMMLSGVSVEKLGRGRCGASCEQKSLAIFSNSF